MSLIEIDFDSTPDKILPLAIGERTLIIKDVKTEPDPNNSDQTVVIAEMQVNEPDSDEHERRTWDRFYLQYAPARVKFKQLCKSAGYVTEGKGVDPSELIECAVKALVKTRHYKDEDGNYHQGVPPCNRDRTTAVRAVAVILEVVE